MAGLMGAAPPGLAGWLLADEARRAQQGAQMQRFQGLLGAEQTMNNMAEQQRVRGLMGQIPGAMQSGDESQLLGLIGQMPGGAQALLPYMLAKKDNPVVATEDIVVDGKPVVALRRKDGTITPTQHTPYKSAGQGSATERAWNGINDLEEKARGGYVLTPRDRMNANAWKTELEAPKFSIDPATGRGVWTQPKSLGPEYTIFGQTPGAAPQPGAPAPAAGASPILKPGQDLPAPGAAPGRRAVTVSEKDDLQALGKAYAQIQEQVKNFDDKFSGYGAQLVGKGIEEADTRLPEDWSPHGGKMANWWRAERQRRADLRRAIAGMTLTGFEKSDFESYNPNTSMDPKVLRKELDRHKTIIEREIKAHLDAAKTSGTNLAQVQSYLGLPVTAAPTNTLQEQLRVQPDVQAARDQEANRLRAAEAQGGAGLLPSSTVLAPGSAPASSGTMSALPPPAQHKGRTVEDVSTGKKYKSDGMRWVEQ